MHPNENLIHLFYGAFQKKDYQTMQNCYSDRAVFNDEVFQNLNAAQVKAMWEMLIKRGNDLQLEYHSVQADDQQGSTEWVASYTFSQTGRKVVNRIKASFVFEKGQIVHHTDHFDFYLWARQALGTPGWLLGWTSFLKNKVRQRAMQTLENFMKKIPS